MTLQTGSSQTRWVVEGSCSVTASGKKLWYLEVVPWIFWYFPLHMAPPEYHAGDSTETGNILNYIFSFDSIKLFTCIASIFATMAQTLTAFQFKSTTLSIIKYSKYIHVICICLQLTFIYLGKKILPVCHFLQQV